ncbi:phage tail tape measure protein [Altericroceibacterium endophyticum]|uniref:Phage tail tape measure protein n=1 Tax=Altericroceibacterium endophyticum TaxID=1808508 RepID=A0A6I4T571_9SPHN|nr:phage tail tape measure protein [Altericroceibacterium endophyticum]MXO64865.1 phage tail tape measure protein [Altericroceibacterium endophyticum]
MNKSLRLQIIFDALDKLSEPLKGISGRSKKLSGDLKETNAEIRRLEKTQKTIDQFRKLKKATRATEAELREAKQAAEQLGREFHQTEAPTKQLGKEFKAARRKVEQLETRLDKQNGTLRDSRSRLSDAGINTRNLSADQRALATRLGQANGELAQQKQRLEALNKANAHARKLRAMGSGVSSAGVKASIGVTAPLAALGNAAFQAASDAAELESAFEVTFGNSAKKMRAWSVETGDLLERSTQEMMAMSMAYQDILKKQVGGGKAVEMSKELTLLTQDLASFKNLSNDVAQQKIFSGLIGEAEPLRAVGVLLSDATVKAKAQAMGLEQLNGEYTEGAKVQARFALIQEQLADAQGDILRTQDSTANRLKASTSAWDELKVAIGDRLLPKLTPVVNAITSLLEAFGKLPPGLQEFIVWAAIIAALLGPVLIAIGGLISVFGALSAVAGALSMGLLPLLGIIALVAAVAVAIGAAAYLIYTHWDSIKAAFASGWQMMLGVWEWIKQTFQKFPALFGPLGIAVALISKHWDAISVIFHAGIEKVKSFFTGLPDWFKTAGLAIITGLVSGLGPAGGILSKKLIAIAKSGITAFKNFFGIHSPSRLFMQMGGYMTEGLARGLEGGTRRPLAALGNLSSAMGARALQAPPKLRLAPAWQPARGAGERGSASAPPSALHIGRIEIQQQPGEDAEALANRIITTIERRRGVDQRSAYYDGE